MILDQEIWNNCAQCGCDLNALRQSGVKNASRIKLFCSRQCRYECKTHKKWVDAVSRCHDPSAQNYEEYGAKGLQVCERWRFSYRLFLEDVGECPGPGYSLDRFPNQVGNYEPGNVRWATYEEQNQNRCSTVLSEELVLQIRDAYDDGEPVVSIARRIEKPYQAVYKAAMGFRWKNV